MLRQKTMLKYTFWGILILLLVPLAIAGNSNGTDVGIMDTSVYPQVASTQIDNNIYIENFTRTINIKEAGLLYAQDEYKFVNNGTNTHFNVLIGFKDVEIDELIYIQVYDEHNGPLASQILEYKISDTNILQIVLSEPLLPNSDMIIKIHYVIKGFIQYRAAYGQFYCHIEMTPKSPYRILDFDTNVYVPEAADNVQVDKMEYYIGPQEGELATPHGFFGGEIPAFTDRENTISFYDSQANILLYLNIERTITVNPWGYVKIEESHTLICLSAGYTTGFTIKLPENYENFKMFDDLGEIIGISPADAANGDGTIDIDVTIIANRAPLQYGQVMEYQIEYEVPYDTYYTNNFGKNNFQIDLFVTHSEFLINELSTQVVLLGATRIDRSNIDPAKISETSKGIVINSNDEFITDLHHFDLDISYRVNFFLVMDRAFIFMFCFILLAAIYVSISNRREKSEDIVISATAIPVKELQQFLTLYEEKNAIRIDLDELEQNFLRRKIQKKVYVTQEKTLSLKMKEIEEEILPFKKDLLESSAAVQAIIQKLDYLEAEKISIKDSIQNLNNRYRKGKLPSKAAYDKLSSDFEKKINASQRKIDRNINELRAYLI